MRLKERERGLTPEKLILPQHELAQGKVKTARTLNTKPLRFELCGCRGSGSTDLGTWGLDFG